MAMLTVRRRAHFRKGYTKKSGTHVSSAHIPATTFKIKDRGAPGRTPKSKLNGWKASNPAYLRRKSLAKSIRRDGWLTTNRRLADLKDVSTSRETDRAVNDDLYWMKRVYPHKEG